MSRPSNPGDQVEVTIGNIDSRYVDVLGLRLLHGRAPEENERVALVNQHFAQTFWGRDDVVGEYLPPSGSNSEGSQIVGVLENLSYTHPNADIRPLVLRPISSRPASGYLTIESNLTAAALQQSLVQAASAGDLDILVHDLVGLDVLRRDQLAPDRARSFVAITAAILVVAIAILGHYGIQRYLVSMNKRELAIRSAVGASPAMLGRLVLTGSLLMSMPGLIVGSLLASVTVVWLRDSYLSSNVPPGPLVAYTVGGVALLLIWVTLGAAREAGMIRRQGADS